MYKDDKAAQYVGGGGEGVYKRYWDTREGGQGTQREKGVHRGRRGYTEGEGGTQREKGVHRGRRGYIEESEHVTEDTL